MPCIRSCHYLRPALGALPLRCNSIIFGSPLQDLRWCRIKVSREEYFLPHALHPTPLAGGDFIFGSPICWYVPGQHLHPRSVLLQMVRDKMPFANSTRFTQEYAWPPLRFLAAHADAGVVSPHQLHSSMGPPLARLPIFLPRILADCAAEEWL